MEKEQKISTYIKSLIINNTKLEYEGFPSNLNGSIYLEARHGDIELLITVDSDFLDMLMAAAVGLWLNDKAKSLGEYLLEDENIEKSGYSYYIKMWMDGEVIV